MSGASIGTSSVLVANQIGATKPALRQQMNTLFKDIKSGNLSAAKSDYSALSQLLGASGGANAATGAAGSASSNPFSALLGQVGSSLSSGDISGAQDALSDFQNQGPSQTLAQGQAADSIAGQHKHHGNVGKQQGMASLISSIQNGDLGGAQDAYASLTSGASSTGGSQSGGSGNDLVSQLTASVGQSLSFNDMAGAQQDLAKFARVHGVGGAVSVTA
jgi:hypothetical protein